MFVGFVFVLILVILIFGLLLYVVRLVLVMVSVIEMRINCIFLFSVVVFVNFIGKVLFEVVMLNMLELLVMCFYF